MAVLRYTEFILESSMRYNKLVAFMKDLVNEFYTDDSVFFDPDLDSEYEKFERKAQKSILLDVVGMSGFKNEVICVNIDDLCDETDLTEDQIINKIDKILLKHPLIHCEDDSDGQLYYTYKS